MKMHIESEGVLTRSQTDIQVQENIGYFHQYCELYSCLACRSER
jgi:hypothetical protein